MSSPVERREAQQHTISAAQGAFVVVAWFVVGAGLYVARDWNGWLVGLLLGWSTLVLVRDRGFPHRSPALLWSWVGPLLAVASDMGWLRLVGHGGSPYSVDLLWAAVLAQGTILALAVMWLFRGYGLIPLLALGASVPGWRTRLLRTDLMASYPPRWWWMLGLAFMGLAILNAALVYCAMAWTVGEPGP